MSSLHRLSGRWTKFLFFVSLCSFLPISSYAEESPSIEKKKILILSSNGGYGHTAAANTLKALLEKNYIIKIIQPINEIKFSGIPLDEDVFYNSVMNLGWVRPMNFVYNNLAPPVFRLKQNKTERLLQHYLEHETPDLLISIIPFINLPASNAAKKAHIPYLIITTDNDLHNWVLGLEKMTHPDFKITIGKHLNTTTGRLLDKGIPEERILPIGLPLRPDFIQERNKEELRAKYQIPKNKHIVLLMMGGAGSPNALEYTKRILKIQNLPIHLIVCSGRDEKLKRKLQRIHSHHTNSIMVQGFTEKIADLMALSDIVITKPGPGTINEAIALQIPVLVDATSACLYWEQANTDLLCSAHLGNKITHFKETERLLRQYLTNPKVKKETEEALATFPKNQFHQKISAIVDEMTTTKKIPTTLSKATLK